ncbi:ergothioneine biosynthesis protein EgtB [Nocardia donostiensis]|uniref:Hercynine oxygenase n=1 Tax=Nocardia donostiensis TaxID=1538463 RepID=A0A1W0AWA6_9NOCA|nr:ergothioneine biosynthesis protein EgtB [Nocardia donostiensis]ONM48294.1 sulfatase-modifying factor 1 [Nocardia donostiensis]OQS14510.1 sulfatase-modifying factor 1 [Nocardia donostiensis]OQS20596.1 sulfatase-modifying factor 1 [Nocardia donostiensis]
MTVHHQPDIDRSTDRLRDRIAETLTRARNRTIALTACVDEAELVAQHSQLMSPLVWDLAHIGNQEELWLVRDVGGREPVRADIDELYDAFKHARANRPQLPLLNPEQARGYVGTVRQQVWDVLECSPLRGDRLVDRGFAFGMIAQHEQQHDETMLATHQLRSGPAVLSAPAAPQAVAPVRGEVVIPTGEFTMGTSTDPWALDNERPAHPVHVPGFAIDAAPITNEQYLAFLDDGGYERPELWSERGWAHRQQAGLVAPQFWEQDAGGHWWRRVFGAMTPLRPHQPVVHVCWFEAQAYANWAGKRLPTEAEWEKAARFDPATGRSRRYPWGETEPGPGTANLGQQHLEPADIGAYPDGASESGVQQLIGDVWEWTSSGFEPYPGFQAFPYREYSEVFFGGDYRVLRGGSFGTDPVACRGTFRNWDHPIRRQIFAGFRLARDLGPGEG